MSKFRTVPYIFTNKAGHTLEFTADVQIDAKGWFYANLPESLLPAFPSEHLAYSPRKAPEGRFRASAQTFEALDSAIRLAGIRAIEPKVEEFPVIRYHVAAQIAFAETAEGTIFPNAGFPGAQWVVGETGFMEISATHPAQGGYHLVTGAKALLKRVVRYEDNETVQYLPYYQKGTHLDHETPAQLLNAWAGFTLPAKAQEIPYSDEAALFFHNLLLGMAQLSRIMRTLNDRAVLEQVLKDGLPFLRLNVPGAPTGTFSLAPIELPKQGGNHA